MESFILNNYRCDCGKLLFRGTLLVCKLEIKCKRCGIIKSIGGILGSGHSEHGYSMLVTRGNEGAYILDATASAVDILGYSQAELCAKRLCEIDAQFPEGLYSHLWDTLRSRSPSFSLDTLQRSKGGGALIVRMNFNFFTLDRNAYAFVTVDVPMGQKETQKNIVLEKSSNVIKEACDFFCDVDSDGRYTHVSQSILDALKYSARDLIGQSIFDGPIHDGEAGSRIKYLFTQKKPFRVQQCSVRYKDGSDGKNDVYFIPSFAVSGTFLGYHMAAWSSSGHKTELA